jgi:hypothetical protein
MRKKREITHIFVAKKTNKQTNKKKEEVDMYTMFEIFVLFILWFFFFVFNELKKTKIIYIFFILLSSLINSSTCGERVDECTLSRSKQSINDNVISSLP